ncbi:MAG TPA: MarP family serine protease [Acidimicrobiales bacterium]|nr:MarP family serine protease [Acidimicrobiales bacterium]
MNALDIGILVVAGFAMLGGWRLGFFGRVFSWLGLGAGLYLAVRFMPNIVSFVGLSGSVARMVLAVGVLVGGALIGQAVGLMVGSRLHAVLPPFAGVRTLDRLVGAVVGALGVFAALWLLAPSLSAVPGTVSQLTTGSVITRWLSNETRSYGLSPPNTLQALRRLVSEDGFPQVFDQIVPGQDVGPPPGSVPLAPSLVTSVSASTVKVEGQACGRIQEGSGWTVGPDLVVTNAHVVAGEPAGSTSVLMPDGTVKPATVVLYNPDVDLSLLSVPGLGEQPLQLGQGSVGDKGAVFGHPNGQDPLAVQPATIAQEVTAVGEDLYDNRSTERKVYVLAAKLTYGDSGAPVVGADGQVLGIAFAIAPDRPTTAYALSTSELRPLLSAPHSTAVSTEGCVTG